MRLKRTLLILGVALICVLGASALLVGTYLTGVKPVPVPTPVIVQPPPSALGCHQYNETEGWVSAPCVPPGPTVNHGLEGGCNPSQEQCTQEGYSNGWDPGILGIASIPASASASPTLIKQAQVQVSFSTESAEINVGGTGSDIYPFGGFSIQLNSNLFYGNNKDLDWVQFIFFARHAPGNATNYQDGLNDQGVCAGEVDITTSTYSNISCYNYNVPAQVLSSGYSVTLTGLVGQLPFGTNNLIFAVLSLPNGLTFETAQADTYGLTGNWYQASGTILGWANGSQAFFFGPTTEYTNILVTGCSQSQGWTCNSPTLDGEVFGYSGYPGYNTGTTGLPGGTFGGTFESNDLNYTSPTPPSNSTLTCSNGQCILSTESCFMGTGSTCVSSPLIPGFPLEAIMIGLAVGVIFLIVKRKSSRFARVRFITR